MQCPVCKDVNLAISDRQGIEIDYCPQCRGVWLDRGELDKIIERSDIGAPPPRTSSQGDRPYREDQRHDRDDRYKHKRRKSFLAELFD